MKQILFSLLVVFSFNLQAAISILSDLDDTIKITQSSGSASEVLRDKVFSGMPGFFKAAQDYTNELHILSASPIFMRSHILEVLQKKDIQYRSLTLRENLLENKYRYKLRQLKNLFNKSADDFILIGDDLGDDPEVYAEMLRLYPNRILDIYIHVINDRPISHLKLNRFYTTADLLLLEFLAGRMGNSRVLTGLEELMSETQMELIFPKRARCPSHEATWSWQELTPFAVEARQLTKRLVDFCRQRQSVIILP